MTKKKTSKKVAKKIVKAKVGKKVSKVVKKAKPKLPSSQSEKANLELSFQNSVEELAGLKGQREYCSCLYAAVQRFHLEIKALNQKYNVKVKDTVYFELTP